MIVQELNKLQKKYGYIAEQPLRALAQRTGIPLYRWQEVASFFPHFRQQAPPKVDVRICRDMSCRLRGSATLESAVRELTEEMPQDQVCVQGVSCLGRCDRAPAAYINERVYVRRGADELLEIVKAFQQDASPDPDWDKDLSRQSAKPWEIDIYHGEVKYEAVKQYVTDPTFDADRVIRALETAALLGMGGAGGRAYKKWDDVRRADGQQKYVVCNADESEPGTFKDRELLLRTPHLVLEGMIVGGLVVGADQGYVYIRHEYEEQIEAIRGAIVEAQRLGACGENIFGSGQTFELDVFVSPGGYICGEQTALIEAMEDKRAEPRNRPPQLQTNGLWDKPTLLNNVETLAWIPAIVLTEDGNWFASAGSKDAKGLRFFSVSGDVNKPGVYEVPNGITLGTLISEYAGGMRDDKPLKAFAPSGPSGGFLPARIPVDQLSSQFASTLPKNTTHFDILDWELSIPMARKMDLMLGGGLIVYAEGTDMVDQALTCSRFFRNESCGKCVPCRIGSQKIVDMLSQLHGRRYDRAAVDVTAEVAEELGQAMEITSICGLGMVASKPIRSLLQFFPGEVDQYLRTGPASS